MGPRVRRMLSDDDIKEVLDGTRNHFIGGQYYLVLPSYKTSIKLILCLLVGIGVNNCNASRHESELCSKII